MGMDWAQSHRRRIRRDEISVAVVLGRPLPVSGAMFPVRGCKTVDECGWVTCSRRFLEDFLTVPVPWVACRIYRCRF